MTDVLNDNSEHKRKAWLFSFIIHVFLLALFIFLRLYLPNPPPSEEGIMIALGNVESAYGNEQPEVINQEDISEQESAESVQSQEVIQDEVLTQDYEDAPVINNKKDDAKKNDEIEDEIEDKKEEVVTKDEPMLDMNALYTGKKSDKDKQNDQGKDKGKGDQGKENGNPLSNTKGDVNYGLGDEGFSFSLSGRSILKMPSIQHSSQTTGTIVIRIKVDEEGNVINADYTSKGSTTSDPYLIGVAKRSAQKAKFSAHPHGQDEQWGSITFVFKLK